jgi:hypothetical protein
MLTNRKFRGDPRYSFILALAFSDFFLCNFTSPLTLWTTLKGHWPLGENTRILCKFVKASQDFPIIMSSFCIGAIACDRFRFIVQNNLPQMTANQGLIFAFLLALIGSCFVCPVFVKADLVYSSPVYLDKTLFCEVDFPKEYSYLYTLITSIAHYFPILNLAIVHFGFILMMPISQNYMGAEIPVKLIEPLHTIPTLLFRLSSIYFISAMSDTYEKFVLWKNIYFAIELVLFVLCANLIGYLEIHNPERRLTHNANADIMYVIFHFLKLK